jgi:parallel beta-helix repeat protein
MHRSLRRLVLLAGTLAVGAATAVVAAPTAHAQTLPSTVVAADSYVDSALPTTNFGSKIYLYADASPARTSYLKFSVSSISATPVKLRIFAESASNTGLSTFRVSDSSWTETGLTFANRPALGAQVGSPAPITAGSWVEVDVTSVVNAPGTYSFAVTTTSNTAVKITSREGVNKPELTFGALPTSTTFLVSRNGSAYTAQGDEGASFSGSLKFVGEQAVNELKAAGGGTVNFTPGTFDFGTEFFKLENVSDIVFAGAGPDSTTIRNDNSSAADTEPFNFTGATRITIKDMTVVAGGAVRSTSDAIDFDKGNESVVDNVKITGSRARGIVFDGKNAGWTADGNIVRNCVITNVASQGIEFLASSDNRVENCTISNTGGAGIQAGKASSVADQPNKKSSNNIITGNTIDQAGRDGIFVNSGDRNQVTGNLVTNSSDDVTSRDGIRIQSSDGITCDDNVVSGNTATDNQPTKTQRYGLNINNPQCNRTVVGPGNNFTGNIISANDGIRNAGTGTVFVEP